MPAIRAMPGVDVVCLERFENRIMSSLDIVILAVSRTIMPEHVHQCSFKLGLRIQSDPDDSRQGAVRREWRVLFKDYNAGLDHLVYSLRAFCEALVRVVEPLGNG